MQYADSTLKSYLDDAASDNPTPGGGSISGLVGALASSMSEMAANLTVGKEQYLDVEQDVKDCLRELQEAREELLCLLDDDAEAYGKVGEAYRLPRDTEAEKAARDEAIQAALKGAMHVPFNIMRQCATVAEMSACLVDIANRNLLTDVGVSAILAEAACAAARLNVEVNLKFLKDGTLVDRVRPELDELSESTRRCRAEVSDKLADHLSN